MKRSIGAQSLVMPCPVFIVGTYDEKGVPNMMNAAWGGICCSQPPCVQVSLRKATYTYHNIVEQKAFTINIPSLSKITEADYVGIYSGKNENKFEATGLTAVKSAIVHAPFIDEFPMVLECSLIHTLEIGLHTLFVGEIKDIKVEAAMLNDKGLPALEKIQPFIYDHSSQGYYAIGKHAAKAFSIGKKK
jgi:flavin reductase (DIM6/NTAB) family NADH-FMN oxidoreductase RutF